MSSASLRPQEAPRGSDTSMEEILASIRRIIADDQDVAKAQPEAARQDEAAAAVNMREAEVLDLAELTTEAAKAAKPAEPAEDDVTFREDEPAPVEVAAAPQPAAPLVQALAEVGAAVQPAQPVETYGLTGDNLLSANAGASVASAFQSLATTVLTNNARTLEDLVRDMLRPMLKGWLDDNLPAIVERLVRAEIERVARGGRF
ncbi:DUF2497 domain-containing protein [Chelatococcus sp. SYSU_G07232]|uniref:DUF2497 domain-containing protein n=1 Tax=Chelatococcus albus TaxID=3047466 RepID=A0ABT7ACD1_9HYPH|nr:DUF2497 domain-containing protein [Chelatococcus sp. SYSU_G07232]MDJ1157020.1 DUF2497 domain-containing protein [Chelatococcus sp. SYSU_G07232]